MVIRINRLKHLEVSPLIYNNYQYAILPLIYRNNYICFTYPLKFDSTYKTGPYLIKGSFVLIIEPIVQLILVIRIRHVYLESLVYIFKVTIDYTFILFLHFPTAILVYLSLSICHLSLADLLKLIGTKFADLLAKASEDELPIVDELKNQSELADFGDNAVFAFIIGAAIEARRGELCEMSA